MVSGTSRGSHCLGRDIATDEDVFITVTDASMDGSCTIAKPYALFAKKPETWTEIEVPLVKVKLASMPVYYE